MRWYIKRGLSKYVDSKCLYKGFEMILTNVYNKGVNVTNELLLIINTININFG